MITQLVKRAKEKLLAPKQSERIIEFCIVGVCKGGTESAIANLNLHPEIYISAEEINFFNRDYILGLDYYRKFFNYKKPIVGEKTPHYYMQESTIKRMKEFCPDLKLLLLIRDPVKRFFSHWSMIKDHHEDLISGRNKYNHKNYPDYVKFLKSFEDSNGDFFSTAECIKKNMLIEEGFYFDKIQSISKYYNKDQIYIGISEKIMGNMTAEYSHILKFLGATDMHINYIGDVHKRKYKSSLDEESKQRLIEIYKPHNEKLFKFLGGPIEEWIS